MQRSFFFCGGDDISPGLPETLRPLVVTVCNPEIYLLVLPVIVASCGNIITDKMFESKKMEQNKKIYNKNIE